MRTSSTMVLWILTAAAAPALAEAPPAALGVDASHSSVKYSLVHKLHHFEATSHAVEGKARILPDGDAQVMVRVPVESFDSGNVNRDEHMKETVEAARYPTIELKALGAGLTPPAKYPTTIEKRFKAQVTFHGVQQVMEVPVSVTFEAPERVHARTAFAVSVESFKIERPSLLFVKIDDAMKIEADLVFKRP